MLEPYIKVLATIYTGILIALVTSLLFFGGYKIKSPMAKGKVIQATIVDISQLKSKNTKITNEQPVKKTPVKVEPPIKKEIIKKEIEKVEPVKKEPPRIIKKTPQVDTKAQELERKERLERQKKLKVIQEKKKAVEKRRKIEEQNLKELAKKTQIETEVKPKQVVGVDNGQSEADKRNQLMTQYQLAVISAVERQWNKPATANTGLICHVKVRQIPGGGVIDATIGSPCNANTIVKNSIIAAIKKADPLPYKGFENVFDRNATFIFQPQE